MEYIQRAVDGGLKKPLIPACPPVPPPAALRPPLMLECAPRPLVFEAPPCPRWCCPELPGFEARPPRTTCKANDRALSQLCVVAVICWLSSAGRYFQLPVSA